MNSPSEKRLLDILVPTYGRPAGAKRAIESVSALKDPRVGVICHSNGHEPALEKYRDSNSAVSYQSFEYNMGPEANFLWLLEESNATFCMLLSDEDFLLASSLPEFLDFLECVDVDCNLVSCSVFDEAQGKFYSRMSNDPDHHAVSEIDTLRLNLAGFTNLVASTYMSGYVYRTSSLKDLNLAYLTGAYAPHCRNVYSPVDLAQQVLVAGTARTYSPKLVMKGLEIASGGHAFSHRSDTQGLDDENLDLNPDVYGPYARVSQYFYREKLLTELRANFAGLSYMIADAKLYAFFFQVFLNSPNVVVFPQGMSLRSEGKRAVHDAIADNIFTGTTSTNIFVEAICGSEEVMTQAMNKMSIIQSIPLSAMLSQYISD